MANRKYHITVIGCAMNKSDSERIAGYLDGLGFSETEDYKTADLAIITTCGVRQSPEDRIYGLVSAIKKTNPRTRVIITGCLSDEKVVRDRVGDKADIWMPIAELPGLREKLAALPEFSSVAKRGLDRMKDSSYLSLHPKYKSAFTAFVPIGNGCDNFCSYCYVPYARGREVYRSAREISAEVSDLVSRGFKEIVLIAQNVNSYRDGDTDFAKLLAMADAIEGDFWIRFSTSHPKDMSDELIRTAAKCAKVCRYVHLPVQSGDDEILARMNRHYTQEHYLKLLHKIKYEFDEKHRDFKKGKTVPGEAWTAPVSITTDCIVGFPGETAEQFENTRLLFEEACFDMAYIAQYSPRPRTVSAKMADDVAPEEKKRREKELNIVLKETSFGNNKRYIGRKVAVLIEGISRKGELFGRTETNKVVKLTQGSKADVGSFRLAEITEADVFGLKGVI